MIITVTPHAYEQYAASVSASETVSLHRLQRRLHQEYLCGTMLYVKLQGKSAIFLLDAYWEYTLNEGEQELRLIKCLAFVKPVSLRQSFRPTIG